MVQEANALSAEEIAEFNRLKFSALSKKVPDDNAMNTLFIRVQQATAGLFNSPDDFDKWVDSTYGQSNRIFHGRGHLLEMTKQDSGWVASSYEDLQESMKQSYGQEFSDEQLKDLKRINLVAGLGHDTEYHVDGKLTDVGKVLLNPYIETDEKGYRVKQTIDPDDRVAHMVLDVFGFKPGQELQSFAGQNEFLSALAIAKQLEGMTPVKGEPKVDFDFITGVVASIETTWPFKNQIEFNKLRDRLDKIYGVADGVIVDGELAEKYVSPLDRQKRVDALMASATLLANQDVLGFLGGLRPDIQTKATPTVDSVSEALRGGDLLVSEEGSRNLQRAQGAGQGYTALELLKPSFKRVRLFDFLLKPESENLFHGMEIRGNGTSLSFPPVDVVRRMNEAARNHDGKSGNADIARIASAARVTAIGIVYALAQKAGIDDQDMNTLLGGMTETHLKHDFKKSPQLGEAEQLAAEALRHRTHNLKYDIRNSPIATRLLEAYGAVEINRLYDLTEKYLGEKLDYSQKPPKASPLLPEKFLAEVGVIMGADKLEKIRDAMVKVIKDRSHDGSEDMQVAQKLQSIEIPREIAL